MYQDIHASYLLKFYVVFKKFKWLFFRPSNEQSIKCDEIKWSDTISVPWIPSFKETVTFSLIWHFGIKRQDHLQRDRSKIQLGYFRKVKNFKEENQLVPSHKSGLKWAWSKFFGLKLDELWISDQKKKNKVSRPVWVKCRVCPVLYEQRWLLNVVWQLTVCLSKGACRQCVSTREKHVFKLI